MEEYVQITQPDKIVLAGLLKEAKGQHRTMASFSKDSGVNAGTLSIIAQSKINKPVTMAVLKKIYDARCDTCAFDFEELANANGMLRKDKFDKQQELVAAGYDFNETDDLKERHMRNAIVSAILEQGISVKAIEATKISEGGMAFVNSWASFSPNFGLYVGDGEREYQWHFFVQNENVWAETVDTLTELRYFLAEAWHREEYKGIKTSFLFSKERAYDVFLNKYRNCSVASATSVLLIDTKEEKIREEMWICKPQDMPETLQVVLEGSE